MSVHDAEELAKRYDLIVLLENQLTTPFIEKVTINLKGFRPRESAIETIQEWFEKYKSSSPVFLELFDILTGYSEEITSKYHLTKQEALNGLIGAFRLLQKKEGFRPNLNGYKFGGIQTLLRYHKSKEGVSIDRKEVAITGNINSKRRSNDNLHVNNLIVVYVGDSKDVIRRILTNHCGGNVEASAFRKHVAMAKGYRINKKKRARGSMKVTPDLPNPRIGEKEVSKYIHFGKWRYILCDSYPDANDLQWYMIEKLQPLLNRNCKKWDYGNKQRYQLLFNKLIISPAKKCSELHNMKTGPGVYLFYHQQKP